ncbi:family 78 glycoside hydrolase catalytic domain [Paenibacillus caseinilyticus]|uniref:alpha-L-rhamnosidase n=1 Tax=Paenibacillus mucilaginosus K02 TaxID=997761 RepID=I0BGG5_9BACL|nr:alpha-L-rhamnosidase [Paenibacillus mucilaginosus]AFH61462.1 alpha-L-rhamnosidase [Paenibacillus mucilaginosus K02]
MAAGHQANQLQAINLRCDYRKNPIGTGEKQPRFSWQLISEDRGTTQTAYRVQVGRESGDFGEPFWDSGKIPSEDSLHVKYEGPQLASRTRYYYRVKVWDQAGNESAWSEPAWWETGLLDESEWKAQWITPHPDAVDPRTEAVFLLRKRIHVRPGLQRAVAYASALGLYELYVNGERAGDAELTPGWTSYHHRIQYQAYDVTRHLQEGGGGIGILLADGWYKGGMGDAHNRFRYGERRAAFLQLHLRYEDGNEEAVVTDASWLASTGPILSSSLYDGEVYDARLERSGWCGASAEELGWHPVTAVEPPAAQLIAQENEPVRVTQVIRPVRSFLTPAGAAVLDMGQNMVGRIRLKPDVPAGTVLTLRHAEVLDRDGEVYFGNLRTAKQTVVYTAKGEPGETYAPHFSFQGFRYVQVEVLPIRENGPESHSGPLPLDCFAGEVMHTDMEPAGSFECSHEGINQLQRNIVWGQRGNFVDVPTDCPQRDERLGWTADAQVFMRTALFNYNGGAFFTKWLRDLKADQLPDGGVPFVVPDTKVGSSSAGWGDAAVICPWIFYQVYGDRQLLEEQYDSMKGWVEYIRAQGPSEYAWTTGFHFGDWLALDAKENSFTGATPKELIATAYYAYSTRLLRDAAAVLGRTEDVREYTELYEKVVAQFRGEYVTPFGRIASPTQTAHVIALAFDLVEAPMKARIAQSLNELIAEHNGHLSTGFIGTPLLCFALSDHGYHDTALKLLLQEDYPGWLYAVSQGATTIWEHWDGIKADGSFWSDHMNSFNHYAYGSIGDWLYRRVAGIDLDPAAPAYKRIRIAPGIGGRRLTSARASHESMYGMIACSWQVVNREEVHVTVRIPANTTASVILPGCTLAGLAEGGIPAASAAGLSVFEEGADSLAFEAGSGEYRFVYRAPALFANRFTVENKVRELQDDPEVREVMERHLPELLAPPLMYFAKNWTLQQLADDPQLPVTDERIAALLQELQEA